MSVGGEGPDIAQSPVDVKYTADMSQRMTVPHHIRFGEPSSHQSRAPGMEEGELRRQMNVPDRIVVAGGGSHARGEVAPTEIALDKKTLPKSYGENGMGGVPILLSTPPSTLTLQERTFPSVEEEPQRNAQNPTGTGGPEEAAAPEWFRHMGLPTSTGEAILTPASQVNQLKIEMAKVNARVETLEQEIQNRKTFETAMYFLGAVYFSYKTLAYLFGRLSR